MTTRPRALPVPLLPLSAMLVVAGVFVACGSDDSPNSVPGTGGSVSGNDAGDATAKGGSGGTAQGGSGGTAQGGSGGTGVGGGVEAGTEASLDAPSDTGLVDVTEPGAGELGGVCATGDQCTEGKCEQLPGNYGKRCTQSCTSNDECPSTLRCEAVSDFDMFCLFGPRGTGKIGEPCGEGKKGLGCESGLCVDADPEEAIAVDSCTDTCEKDTDCTVPFPICVGLVNLCLPILSGDLGGLCDVSDTCVDSDCIAVEGLGKRCTHTCKQGDDCGQPYLECRQAGSEWYCLMKQ